jgi:hypothetical protein
MLLDRHSCHATAGGMTIRPARRRPAQASKPMAVPASPVYTVHQRWAPGASGRLANVANARVVVVTARATRNSEWGAAGMAAGLAWGAGAGAARRAPRERALPGTRHQLAVRRG